MFIFLFKGITCIHIFFVSGDREWTDKNPQHNKREK